MIDAFANSDEPRTRSGRGRRRAGFLACLAVCAGALLAAPAAAKQHRPTSFDTIDVVQYCKAKALKDVRGSSAPTDFLHCVNSVLRKMEAKTLGFLDSLLAKTGGCKEVGKGLNKRYYYETILILAEKNVAEFETLIRSVRHLPRHLGGKEKENAQAC